MTKAATNLLADYWWWFWFMTATQHATISALCLIDDLTACPPRPIPWYTYAYLFGAALASGAAGLWGVWLQWDALWSWANSLRAKRRGKRP